MIAPQALFRWLPNIPGVGILAVRRDIYIYIYITFARLFEECQRCCAVGGSTWKFFSAMDVGWTILEKYRGVRAPPGTTLARCIHFSRNRFLDPNLVSYAKIEVAFGGFWRSLACSWAMLGWLGVTGWSHGALGASKTAQAGVRKDGLGSGKVKSLLRVMFGSHRNSACGAHHALRGWF